MLVCLLSHVSYAALANFFADDPGEAVSESINAAHKLVAATFVAGASHSFDRILFLGALFSCQTSYKPSHLAAMKKSCSFQEESECCIHRFCCQALARPSGARLNALAPSFATFFKM